MAAVPLTPFKHLPSEFRTALHAFAQSSSPFRILRTLRSDNPYPASSTAHSAPADTLHVLDSSFNPPTLGHLSIALSALREDTSEPSKHILLLLATQNADKAPKPAAFEQRLAMMGIMAESILSEFRSGTSTSTSTSTATESAPAPGVTVSIGVTKYPYFIDKSNAIAEAHSESPFPYPPTRQIHLIGFDTFTRLFDTQYYPQNSLASLEPLFANHFVRVTFRTGDKYGSKEDQERYVRDIADGKRDEDGARPEWAGKVSIVEGRNDELVTSSTKAREAVKSGDNAIIEQMCGPTIAQWVLSEKLYTENPEA